jgi:hypothetical protein
MDKFLAFPTLGSVRLLPMEYGYVESLKGGFELGAFLWVLNAAKMHLNSRLSSFIVALNRLLWAQLSVELSKDTYANFGRGLSK